MFKTFMFLAFLLTGCGGGGSGGSQSDVALEGSAVKGPLAGATARLYKLDLTQIDLKGTLLDEGSTNSTAAIEGLTIENDLAGLVLLEFIVEGDTIEINTGEAPVFDRLVTVFNVQRVYDGDNIYASPLTTMTVALAQKKADKLAPFSGNNDDVISEQEFITALGVAQNQIKSTLGFGLESTVDIFVVPPMLTEETDTTEEQTHVVKYRQAIEALAAVTSQIAEDSSSNNDSAQDILDALVEDLTDGNIDGQGDEGVIDTLAALDTPIDNTLANLNLSALNIPGTNRPVSDIEDELINETELTGEETDTSALEDEGSIDVDLEKPELVVDSDSDGVDDSQDAFPFDGNETIDTDNDGRGDNADAFPNDPTETTDSDDDGTGDNADAFPHDPTEITDSDDDGVGDNTDIFSIGGTVTSLSTSQSVVLQNNSSDNLTVNNNGDFSFTTPVADGLGYSVRVMTQPIGQICSASSNSGTVNEVNVTNIVVTCVDAYSIGGTVTGLGVGQNLVLQNNSGDDLAVNTDGAFNFASVLADGSSYSVMVNTQPAGQTCSASSNSGTLNGVDIANVAINCVTPVLDAEAKPAAVTLSWNNTGATSYNLYYSTAPSCDIDNYSSCASGTMVANVTSPYTINNLTNAQSYWFMLESDASGGNATSNEAGARPDQLVTNGSVHAITHDDSGVTYLGGSFTQVGMRTGYGIPLNSDTGQPGVFPLVNDSIYAVTSDGADGYYIGGDFTAVDGQTRNHLAHILADGTLGSWNPDADGTVVALVVSGSSVYVGGQFSTIGGEARNNIAAIGTDGTLSTWDPDANNTVHTLTVLNNMVYAGGQFTAVGGEGRSRLAAIGTDGTLGSWNPGANSTVRTLAVSGSMVYVGGQFTTIGGVTRSRLAAIGVDGTLDIWNPNANGSVRALAVSGSTVYVGGQFSTIGGETRSLLAAIDTDGTLGSWSPAVSGLSVHTLTVSGNTVYIGGWIVSVDGVTRNNIAAIGTDGTLSTWSPNVGDVVNAISASSSTVYVGGDFTMAGGEIRNRVAAIDSDGTLSTTWNPNADSSVLTLAASDSTVYLGGRFTTIGGETRNRLAAINTDGTLSSTWNPNANNSVNALNIADSTVYAGGSFTSIGGISRSRLAAINTDGTLNSSWNPSANNDVDVITISNDTIYAGGWFTTIDSTARNYLAAIGTDGVLASWNPAANHLAPFFINNMISSIAVSGSTVYVGGGFLTIDDGSGEQARNNVAAIGTDGVLASWNPGVNGSVHCLAVSGSTVYASGTFTAVGGVTRNKLAAIGTDGTLEIWDPDADNTVYTLVISDGSLYVGGSFTNVGGELSPNFATLAP